MNKKINITNRLLWQLAKISRLSFWYLASHCDIHLISVIYIFIAVSISMAILGIAAYLTSWPMIFPSLGPTIFLMFYAPSSPLSAPRNAIFGHVGAVLIGLLCYWITLKLNATGIVEGVLDNSSLPIILESSVALGLTGVFMTITGFIHPPAASSALIASLGLMPNWHNVLVMITALGLVSAQAWLMHRVNGVKFPTWNPFEETKGLNIKTKLGDLYYKKNANSHTVEELAKMLASRQKIRDD